VAEDLAVLLREALTEYRRQLEELRGIARDAREVLRCVMGDD
jgi:hypothetical protein